MKKGLLSQTTFCDNSRNLLCCVRNGSIWVKTKVGVTLLIAIMVLAITSCTPMGTQVDSEPLPSETISAESNIEEVNIVSAMSNEENAPTIINGENPSLDRSISPYVKDENNVVYENTDWNMTVSDVIRAQEISGECWDQYSEKQPVLHGDSPLPDCPEVTDIYYRFYFTMPSLDMGLFRVETHYNPDLISYDTLFAQRIAELGEADEISDNYAYWDLGVAELFIYPDRDGKHQEWLSGSYESYDIDLLSESDISAYIADIQPSIGHYGWTFDEHVAAGLLSPDNGTLEQQEENGIHNQIFFTTVELGGYSLDAQFVFSETMASLESGDMVLVEIDVTPPGDISLKQWQSSIIEESWINRMFQNQQSLQSPISIGYLLTDTQKELIATNLVKQNSDFSTIADAYDYLNNWSLCALFFDSSRGWVFNGTGVALLTAAQNIS